MSNSMSSTYKSEVIRSLLDNSNGVIIIDPKEECQELQEQVLCLGNIGRGVKMVTFNESEFKEALAPENAIIRHEKIEGEKSIVMIY